MADWDERYYLHRDHAICKRCGAMVGGIVQHMENHDRWHATEPKPWCHDCQSYHHPRPALIDGTGE